MNASQPRRARLLVMTSTFPRWKDDHQPRFVFDLCQQLATNFEVHVLAPHAHGSEARELIDGLQVHRFKYFPARLQRIAYGGGMLSNLRTLPLTWLQLPFFVLSQIWHGARLIRECSADVIHAHWLLPQGLIALAARTVSRRKIPILCTSHGADLFALRGKSISRLVDWTAGRMDALTVVSNAMRSELIDRGLPANRISTVSMGAEVHSLFTPRSHIRRQRATLLFVGRLVEKKGLHLLLAAMPTVLSKYPNLRLRIVGTGPEEVRLRQLARRLDIGHRLEFAGSLSHEALPAEYRSATAAVFPFMVANNGDQEGLGLVVVEAMGCGCPVIAGQVPAVNDVVRHGVTGYLHRPGDSLSLANAICDVLDHPEIRRQLAQAGRDLVVQRYSWPVISKAYTTLLAKQLH